ncbi:pilus assembly protein N-terminal domain-containing protein [Caulobacter endophyticus]|uniref:pilus assembly protein N-terminal domain-containing protein n=1 Tax=Caulobacter endophyticus TaxID=2172652 RepID=UPI002410491B|nr:pilus assembly protein N-terminal domain-containing protein [Caulobacter endophyticus]MDG2530976.1 pilus assembly protein N-terminal domain-containing protein [Caulobacter endophyticus]
MRRLSLAIIAFFSLCGAAVAAQAAVPTAPAPRTMSVAAGQATTLPLGGSAREIVVGDPQIADVSVVNDRTLVILGKRVGVTTVFAFDAQGRPLAGGQVLVTDVAADTVTVQRGASASAYACDGRCTALTPVEPASNQPSVAGQP